MQYLCHASDFVCHCSAQKEWARGREREGLKVRSAPYVPVALSTVLQAANSDLRDMLRISASCLVQSSVIMRDFIIHSTYSGTVQAGSSDCGASHERAGEAVGYRCIALPLLEFHHDDASVCVLHFYRS